MKKLKLDQTTESILESISDGVFTVNQEGLIQSFNKAAEEITGLSREKAFNQPCKHIFKCNLCESDCPLKKTLNTGEIIKNCPAFIINNDGERIPISISTGILKDKEGNILGGVETFRDLSTEELLRKQIQKKWQFGDLLSNSYTMKKIFEILPLISQSESPVLIEGESGTGKEVIARAIHNLSRRKDMPFVPVNCSAIPETLLESELFGYKAGAFSGANKDKIGRFQAADKGVLFLDEIGEIPMHIQVKLLRALQDKKIEPLGSTKPIFCDVRIISATNKSLKEEVDNGKFRLDFFFRINVVKIELPPLRQRRDDIPNLIKQFINQFNKICNKNIKNISPEVLNILYNYDYPGNIRELENIIEYCFVLCNAEIICFNHLPEYLQNSNQKTNQTISYTQTETKNLYETEEEIILKTLQKNNYHKQKTAKELGINPSTLYRKLKKFENK